MISLALSAVFAASISHGDCIAKKAVIPLHEDLADSEYMRVHPSGDFAIIATASGVPSRVVILDLREGVEVIPTPLNAEAYPTEPDWELVASPNHSYDKRTKQYKMQYFRFSDLLSKKRKAAYIHESDFNEFYHSVAKVDENAREASFRVSLWKRTRNKVLTFAKDETGQITGISRAGPDNEALCGLNGGLDSGGLTEPVTSKDGSELSGVGSDGEMHIYKYDGKICDSVEDLGVRTGKANFSYPVPGKKGRLTATEEVMVNGKKVDSAQKRVSVYDRGLKKWLLISDDNESNPSYAGFTRDGRLIYTARVNGAQSLIVADPNQMGGPDWGSCIQKRVQTVELPQPSPTESVR